MYDLLFKVAIGAGAAIGTYLLADKITKAKTGKHIHQHVYIWWSRLRDRVSAWIAKHPNRPLNRVVATLVDIVDAGFVAAAKARVAIHGKDQHNRWVAITEEEVPLDQLRAQFPQLQREGNEVDITAQVLTA